MESKNILITGSGSGLGRAMSIRLAREGYNIILNGRTETKLVETQKLLQEYDVKTLIKVGDVSDSKFVESMIAEIVAEMEILHVAINNAGVSGDAYLLIDIPEEEMQRIMDINLKGTWLVSKFTAKVMKKQRKLKPLRGKIINVSSFMGKEPYPMLGIYGASKAAINSITKSFAKELAPNITVNAICPGFHLTPIYNDDSEFIQKCMDNFNANPILKRIGTAEDVVGLTSFLVSNDSNYITGQAINVGGGVTFQ